MKKQQIFRKILLLALLLTALAFTLVLTVGAETLLPFARSNASLCSEDISMGGASYSGAIDFTMGYNGLDNGRYGQVTYNLKGEYSSVSFSAGFYKGDQRNAKMTVTADGAVLADAVELKYENIARKFTFSVSGVHQLCIVFDSSAYDKTHYAIGNVNFTRSAEKDDEVRISQKGFDSKRYLLQNAKLLEEPFSMGGYDYENGYKLTMGYNGYSDGPYAKVAFNFAGECRSFSFDIAKFFNGKGESYLHSAYLTIEADGATVAGYSEKELKWNDIILPVKLNLIGVEQLVITLKSDGYDKLHWTIGNIKADGIIFADDSAEKEDDDNGGLTIKAVDFETKEPISGVSVSLGGDSETTDFSGCAGFGVDEEKTVTLSLKHSDYIEVVIDNYKVGKGASFDVVAMTKIEETKIVPVSCNGKNISSGSAQINTKANLVASIKVAGSSQNKIIKYQLLQDGSVLSESSSGSFSVKNDRFKKGASLEAALITDEGEVVTCRLNIDVVSFGLTSPSFPAISEKIKVPESVNIFGGMELDFELTDKVKMNFEINNEELKIGFNQEIGDGVDLSKLNKGLRKWMDEHNKTVHSSTVSFEVGGYAIFEVGNNGIKDSKVQVELCVKYKNDVGKTIVGWLVPIRIEIEFNASGELEITAIGYDIENSKLIYPALDLSVPVDITAKGGVGMAIASVGIYGKVGATFKMNILPKFLVDSIVGRGELGVYCKAVGFGETKFKIADGEFVIYEKGEAQNLMMDDYSMIYSAENYSAAETKKASLWTQTYDGVLQTGLPQGIKPKSVNSSGAKLLGYITENSSGISKLNFSLLQSAGWKQSVNVNINSNSDFEFDFYTDGKDIWVIFTEAKSYVADIEDFAEIASKAEVYVAKYNSSTSKFGTPVRLTSNNYFEKNISLTTADGYLTAAYVENSDNHFLGMTENNTIYLNRYIGGEWSKSAKVAENCAAVSDLKAFALGDALCIAAIHDLDSDFTTENDKKVVLYDKKGNATELDSGFCANLEIYNDSLYWYSDGKIYTLDESNSTAVLVTDKISNGGASDFVVMDIEGELMIVYRSYSSEGEEGCCDLYGIINKDGAWTDPVPLMHEDGKYVDGFTAFSFPGYFYTIASFADVSFTVSGLEVESSLVSDHHEVGAHLVLRDVDYDIEQVYGEGDITLEIQVENIGTASSGEFELKVNDDGVDYDVQILPGEIRTFKYNFSLADKKDPVVMVIDENANISYNHVILFCPEFSVNTDSMAVSDDVYLSATVKNIGNLVGSGIMNVRSGDKNGEILYSEGMKLEAEGEKAVLIKLSDKSVKSVYVEFIPSEEELFMLDNYAFVELAKGQSVVYGDTNFDGAVDTKDAVLLAQYLAKWEVEVDSSAADCNADGVVDTKDAVLLAQFLAKWDVTLGK